MVISHRYLMLVEDKFIQGFINIKDGQLEIGGKGSNYSYP